MPTIKINITREQLLELCNKGEITISFCHDEDNMKTIPEPIPEQEQLSFFNLMAQQIEQMKQTGSFRCVETYRTALNHFRQFRNGDDLPVSAISSEMMEQYQSSLKNKHLTMNTVSFHMRILRAVYHRAVKRGLTTDQSPFSNVYTGQARTKKRALTLQMLQTLKQLKLEDKNLEYAKDLFLLSFYLRGMPFIDMAYLMPTDLNHGILKYKRRKTSQPLQIRWEQPMQDIIEKYNNTASPYLLPIICKQNGKERNQYRHQLSKVNKYLKEVAAIAGINVSLTMYCARHTWATVAREIDTPMNIISSAMGHTDERTTEIYIKSVDCNLVDNTNFRIIKMI